MSPRKRYTFFIDEALAAGLKKLKERDGIAESEAVRRAIAGFLVQRRISVDNTKAERKRAATRKRP